MDEAFAGLTSPVFEHAPIDLAFLGELQQDVTALGTRLRVDGSTDIAFLAFLRKVARFGYFSFGPVTIDVHVIEQIVERTARPAPEEGRPFYPVFADDYVRFSRRVMEETRKSGQRRVDELQLLLAFMRLGEGLPGRVFGELGVTPEQVEEYARARKRGDDTLEKLYSPEEVAEYLGVHVQTVRTWIRTGRLPARRLAGQRALRVRASDIQRVLEPVDTALDERASPEAER